MAVVDASVIISAILSGEPHHEESKTWLFSLANSGQQFSAPRDTAENHISPPVCVFSKEKPRAPSLLV